VVLDEFLKELSAISQEMSIVLLNENFKTKWWSEYDIYL
jgi:hypothetical protein